ncbi:integral membrane protein, partial [Streptomyces zinciresistens K42]
GRAAGPRLAAGLAAGAVVLWAWPYYDFFALFGAGADLESVHRSLYRDLGGRYWLALAGVAALVPRWRRDHRDPLVLFFALGALLVAAGWLTGRYSWGRALPAALIPAQLAAALEVLRAGTRRARAVWTGLVAAALCVGAWTQAVTLGYVVPPDALPRAVAERYREPWTGYQWLTPWVRYGDVVMARTAAARQIPAYGPYTVAPGYPDFFLPDEGRRTAAVRRYFAPGTPQDVRRAIVREYRVRWVVDRGAPGPAAAAGPGARPGLRLVARGPDGQALYAVTP